MLLPKVNQMFMLSHYWSDVLAAIRRRMKSFVNVIFLLIWRETQLTVVYAY